VKLTPDELSFFDYAMAVAGWLEPYHNHIRPSPAAVLSGAKQNHGPKALKAAELPTQNGSGTNGHTKRDEEAPPIKEAPELVSQFFDGMTQSNELSHPCR